MQIVMIITGVDIIHHDHFIKEWIEFFFHILGTYTFGFLRFIYCILLVCESFIAFSNLLATNHLPVLCKDNFSPLDRLKLFLLWPN